MGGPGPLRDGHELVAQAHVSEGATDHNLVIAAARAIGVELTPLDAVLEQILSGGRVGADGAGGRDVIGRDRVAEQD